MINYVDFYFLPLSLSLYIFLNFDKNTVKTVIL